MILNKSDSLNRTYLRVSCGTEASDVPLLNMSMVASLYCWRKTEYSRETACLPKVNAKTSSCNVSLATLRQG